MLEATKLEPIEAKCLAQHPRIRHGFFTRVGGVSQAPYAMLNCGPGSADTPGNIAENRARIARHLGSPQADVVTLYQVHSATALSIAGPVAAESRPKADAVVTSTPGLAIGVLTADCSPVLFADPIAGVVAAAHAGWRGAVGGILEAAIAEMERQGAQRANIFAAIGPTINQDSYEVGPEFETELLQSCADNVRYFRRNISHERARFDLPGYVADRLSAAKIGIIERCSPCTYANESLFFSFRRSQRRAEGDYGRQISAIVVT
jgi:YfiH family protein